uniref:Uncharacterized protein n=1 Tax=Solanum tuberosum TaxID=4113 RepID=M1DTI3_SOLTU
MDGPIAGDMDSGDRAVENLKFVGGVAKEIYSTDEEVQLTNISINLVQEQTHDEIPASLDRTITNPYFELEELTYKAEDKQQWTYTHDHANSNGQKQDQHTMDEQGMEKQLEQGNNETRKSQNDQHDPTKPTTLDVVDVESSSHFSFGVKAVDTTPSNTGKQRPGKGVNSINECDYDHTQGQQAISTKSQTKNPSEYSTPAGKSTNSNPNQNVASLSSSDSHVHVNEKGQEAVKLSEQEQSRRDSKSQQ